MKALAIAVVAIWGATAGAQAQPRQAVLTTKGDITCTYPTFVDHQVSTGTVTFTLPEIDGPVSGQGHYVNNGTGYVLSGPEAAAGEVRDDAELILTYRQWSYNGEWLFSEAPAVPTKAQPVTLPLEPGAEVTVTLVNAFADKAPCSGTMVYRIDFTRETQIWQVDLTGHRRLWHREMLFLVDPYTQKFRDFTFEHGFTFSYRLGARVTIEKRKGQWQVKKGEVTRAEVTPEYRQDPRLYTITGQTCHGCDAIRKMAGGPISATVSGQDLILHWPYHAPVAKVASVFAAQCAPGPRKASCESKQRDGSNYADQDGDFFQNARLHVLPLKEAQLAPKVKTSDVPSNLKSQRFEYYVTRVK